MNDYITLTQSQASVAKVFSKSRSTSFATIPPSRGGRSVEAVMISSYIAASKLRASLKAGSFSNVYAGTGE